MRTARVSEVVKLIEVDTFFLVKLNICMVGYTEFIDDLSYKNLKYFKGSAASSPHSLSVTCASLIRIINELEWGSQFFLLRAIIDSRII